MTTRFKRRSYAGENSKGDVPRWHIAAFDYKHGELYRRYKALCGFEIPHPYLRNVMLSKAKTVSGPKCKKCIAKAERTEQ